MATQRGTEKKLIYELANRIHAIRELLITKYQQEKEHGSLKRIFRAFNTYLLFDLQPPALADQLAQLIIFSILYLNSAGKQITNLCQISEIAIGSPLLQAIFDELSFIEIGRASCR